MQVLKIYTRTVEQVSGMTCSSCSTALEQTLTRLPGVASASVSLLAHRVDVRYDAQRMGPRHIIAEVEAAGFEAQMAEETGGTGTDERARERRFWSRKFWTALALSLPVFLLAMVLAYIPGPKEGLDTNVGGFTLGALLKWALTTPVQVVIREIMCISCWPDKLDSSINTPAVLGWLELPLRGL